MICGAICLIQFKFFLMTQPPDYIKLLVVVGGVLI